MSVENPIGACNASVVSDYFLEIINTDPPPPYPGSDDAERTRKWTPRFGLKDDIFHFLAKLGGKDDDDITDTNSTDGNDDVDICDVYYNDTNDTDFPQRALNEFEPETSGLLGDLGSAVNVTFNPESDEYVKSVVYPVISLAAFLLLWVGLILLWKFYFGPERVGFLSGHAITTMNNG